MSSRARSARAERTPRLNLLVLGLTVAACLLAAPGARAACPNEALRTGPAALLPECRAYEMASPVDKSGGGVAMPIEVQAAPGGDAVSFYSSASFAGSPSSPMIAGYIARRGATNWTTESIDAPQVNPAGLMVATSPASSEDLATTLQYSKVALAPGAFEGGSNIYLRDNATGEQVLVTGQASGKLFSNMTGFSSGSFLTATPDFGHVLFTTNVPLLPEAPSGANVYEFTGGELRIVNRLPDGTVSAGGRAVGAQGMSDARVISADGSRVYFAAGASGAKPLYLREDGETTVPVSASQKTGEEGVMASGEFAGASVDGSVAYFTSTVNLTDTSTTANTQTIYRYEAEGGALTDLLAGLDPVKGAQVKRVLAISDDGSHVYFAARSALAEGAVEAGAQGANVYVWHAGEVDLVAAIPAESQESQGPDQSIASPSGDQLAFATVAPLSAEDPPSPACAESFPSEQCRDVYGYDAASEDLECLSCTGAPARGDSDLGGQEFHERGFGDTYARAVLEDGTVFVDTPNRLLGRDVNGVGDAYAWRDGTHALLSTGMSVGESNFADATADASTIFIRTAEPLVGQDIDASVDLYGLRVNGGLAAQDPPGAPQGCEGEGCRGELAPLVPGPVPTTGTDRPDGNLPPACLALSRRAHAVEGKAERLERNARKAGKQRARKLRKQARQQHRRAHKLERKARVCEAGGR